MVALIKATTNLIFLLFCPVLLPVFLLKQAMGNSGMAWIWEQSLWSDYWEVWK